jgi:hypothetical protein
MKIIVKRAGTLVTVTKPKTTLRITSARSVHSTPSRVARALFATVK